MLTSAVRWACHRNEPAWTALYIAEDIVFQEGQPKPPGSGRRKGTQNQATKIQIEEARQTMARKNFNPVIEAIRMFRSRKPLSDQRIKIITELLKYWGARLSTQTINAKISGDLHYSEAVHEILVSADPETLRALEKLSLKLNEVQGQTRAGDVIDVMPALPEPALPPGEDR